MLAYHNVSIYFLTCSKPFICLRKWGRERLNLIFLLVCFFNYSCSSVCGVNLHFVVSTVFMKLHIRNFVILLHWKDSCVLLRRASLSVVPFQSRCAVISSAEFQRLLHILLSIFWDFEILETHVHTFFPYFIS